MEKKDIKVGQAVIYVPKHLLMEDSQERVREDNLGIVSSITELCVFVKYINQSTSQATLSGDLYSIDNRPDLIDKLGLEVKPVNHICELWLKEKYAFELINQLL